MDVVVVVENCIEVRRGSLVQKVSSEVVVSFVRINSITTITHLLDNIANSMAPPVLV